MLVVCHIHGIDLLTVFLSPIFRWFSLFLLVSSSALLNTCIHIYVYRLSHTDTTQDTYTINTYTGTLHSSEHAYTNTHIHTDTNIYTKAHVLMHTPPPLYTHTHTHTRARAGAHSETQA